MWSRRLINPARLIGFTLIEVLIALAVFAAVGITLAKNSSTVVLQTKRMQDRVVALSVASNVANEFFIHTGEKSPFERTGRKTEEIRQADRDWFVETSLRGTADEDLKELVITVSASNEPDRVLAEIKSFVGRH